MIDDVVVSGMSLMLVKNKRVQAQFLVEHLKILELVMKMFPQIPLSAFAVLEKSESKRLLPDSRHSIQICVTICSTVVWNFVEDLCKV